MEIVKIFMERDGMSKNEAIEEYESLRNQVHEILGSGGDYDDVEALLAYDYELEMDYVMDLI